MLQEPRKFGLLVIAVLALGTLWVYGSVRNHDFVDFDDYSYVVDNEHMDEPLDAHWIIHNFEHTHQAHWIPLLWLSYRIDIELFGKNAGAMASVNVALHLINAILLFLLLWKATGARWRSALLAGLFAWHPLHVESVAWITERKDVLSTLFWMLGMLAYVTFRRRLLREVLVGLCLLLGLLAKPMLVSFPLSLLLLDYWPLRRHERERWMTLLNEKLPYFGLAVAAAIIVLQTQSQGGGTNYAAGLPMGVRLAQAIDSYRLYLWQSIWPSELSPMYIHPLSGPSPLALIFSTLLLATLSMLALRQASRRPWIVVGWAWFLVNLLPVIGLVGVGMQLRADRWMYIQLVGLGLAVLWSLSAPRSRTTLGAYVAAGLLLFGAMAVGAKRQVAIWSDTETLFTRALAREPENWYAHHRMAVQRRRAGQFAESSEHYLQAIVGYPNHKYMQGELGDVYEEMGEAEWAAALYANAESRGEADAFADGRLGMVLLRLEQFERSIPLLEAASARDPEAGDLNAGLAFAYARRGEVELASQHLSAAMRHSPTSADGLILLSWVLATSPEGELRQPEIAQRALDEVTMNAEHPRPDFLDALAATRAALGDFAQAYRIASDGADQAEAQGWTHRAAQMRERALLYLERKPFYERRFD